MNIPENLRYTKDHEWIRVQGEIAYVGITDYAQSELGDIVFFDITTVGNTLKKGEPFGTVEAVKTVSDIFMPISGEILEFNPLLENAPQTVNKDPYGEGWIIKVKVLDNSELTELLSAEEYKREIGG